MQKDTVLGCKLSKSISFSQDEELYIATSDTKIKMKEDYAPFVDKILAEIPYAPHNILDLGCGPGYIARRINDVLPDSTVIGIDKSPTMINHAVKVFKKRLKMDCVVNLNPAHEINNAAFTMLRNEFNYSNDYNFGLKYMVADSTRLPFGSFSFDLIMLKGTFKCLDDKLNSLIEMYRVLSRGGEILIYEFRKDIPDDEFTALTKHMSPQKVKSLKRKLNCSLDILEYKKYLSEAGLTDISSIEPDGIDIKIRIFKNYQ